MQWMPSEANAEDAIFEEAGSGRDKPLNVCFGGCGELLEHDHRVVAAFVMTHDLDLLAFVGK